MSEIKLIHSFEVLPKETQQKLLTRLDNQFHSNIDLIKKDLINPEKRFIGLVFENRLISFIQFSSLRDYAELTFKKAKKDPLPELKQIYSNALIEIRQEEKKGKKGFLLKFIWNLNNINLIERFLIKSNGISPADYLLHSVAKEGFNFMEAGLWASGKKYFNRLMQAGLINKTKGVFHNRFELSSEMQDLNQIRKKTNEFKFNKFKKKLFKTPKTKLLPAKTKIR
jgi:hypothetical protein